MAKARSAALLALLLGTACVVPSAERELLLNYFEACHDADPVVMARFGTAPCNPRVDGVVDSFEIVARSGDEVTLAARVRPLGGAVQAQTIRVVLARQDGRLMVSAVTRLPASQTSPAASSAPPN